MNTRDSVAAVRAALPCLPWILIMIVGLCLAITQVAAGELAAGLWAASTALVATGALNLWMTNRRLTARAERAEREAAERGTLRAVFVGGALDGAELPVPVCPCGRDHAMTPIRVETPDGRYVPTGVATTTYRMELAKPENAP